MNRRPRPPGTLIITGAKVELFALARHKVMIRAIAGKTAKLKPVSKTNVGTGKTKFTIRAKLKRGYRYVLQLEYIHRANPRRTRSGARSRCTNSASEHRRDVQQLITKLERELGGRVSDARYARRPHPPRGRRVQLAGATGSQGGAPRVRRSLTWLRSSGPSGTGGRLHEAAPRGPWWRFARPVCRASGSANLEESRLGRAEQHVVSLEAAQGDEVRAPTEPVAVHPQVPPDPQ